MITILLFLMACVAGGNGVILLQKASVDYQQSGYLSFVAAAVLFVGAAIVSELADLRKDLRR